MLKMQLPHVP